MVHEISIVILKSVFHYLQYLKRLLLTVNYQKNQETNVKAAFDKFLETINACNYIFGILRKF